MESNPGLVDTSISTAIDLKFLRQSENPLEKSNAEIISILQDLKNMIGDLTNKLERGRTSASELYNKPISYSDVITSFQSGKESYLDRFISPIVREEIEKIVKTTSGEKKDIEPKSK